MIEEFTEVVVGTAGGILNLLEVELVSCLGSFNIPCSLEMMKNEGIHESMRMYGRIVNGSC